MNASNHIPFLIMYWVLQWTWGILQNIGGFINFLILKKTNISSCHGAIVSDYRPRSRRLRTGCFATGMFIFLDESRTRDPDTRARLITHEYGHTIQSIIFGPLFIPFVALPSMAWSLIYSKRRSYYRSQGVLYTSRYPEKQANRYGEAVLKREATNW